MTQDQEFTYCLKNEQEFIIRLKNSRRSFLGRKNVKRKQGNQIRIVVLDPGHKSLKATQVLIITYRQERQTISAVTTTKDRLSKFSRYFEGSITKTCLLQTVCEDKRTLQWLVKFTSAGVQTGSF